MKILPDDDKAIACTTNGNFVDVWGFQLKESSGKSLDPNEFEKLLESDSNLSSISVNHRITKLEKKISDISIADYDAIDLPNGGEKKNESKHLEPPVSNHIYQSKPELQPAVSSFKYIPKADGSSALNLDMNNFLKQVILLISYF